MTTSTRRQALRRLVGGALGVAAGLAGMAGGLVGRVSAATPRREIAVAAQRFGFVPAEIALKVGEPVVLLVRSLDFPHGFSVPDLAVRADLVPGQAVRIELAATKAGTVDFLCDNFCGDGHEGMHGRFIVSA